jgi:hypothetical protein
VGPIWAKKGGRAKISARCRGEIIGGARLPTGPTFSRSDWFYPIKRDARPLEVPSRGVALGHGSDFAQVSKLRAYRDTDATSDKSARFSI